MAREYTETGIGFKILNGEIPTKVGFYIVRNRWQVPRTEEATGVPRDLRSRSWAGAG